MHKISLTISVLSSYQKKEDWKRGDTNSLLQILAELIHWYSPASSCIALDIRPVLKFSVSVTRSILTGKF